MINIMKFKLLTSNKIVKDINEIIKDALRYRFLRDYSSLKEEHPYVAKDERNLSGSWVANPISGEELDKLIDSYILNNTK